MKEAKISETAADLAQAIRSKALECGYDDCGIVSVDALDAYKEQLTERMKKFPESALVYSFADAFTNLKRDYPWARSVVVCTDWYGKYQFPASLRGRYSKSFLLSTATVPESPAHRQKKQFEVWMRANGIQFAGGETNMPAKIMPLRLAAAAAGLGVIRRNNFFYGPKGSYYSLEGYLVDKSCEYIQETKLKPCSEKCGLCQRACKTRALVDSYTMNPLSCVSFWTTFGGGQVPEHLKAEQFGEWILGCDACQDACPHNIRHNWDEGEDFPGLKELAPTLDPNAVVEASDEELIEKVIPKSEFHLTNEQTETLRVCARRMLKYAEQTKRQ